MSIADFKSDRELVAFARAVGADPRHLSFFAFLPDQYFADVWQLLKLCSARSELTYSLTFGFIGFIPHKVKDQPSDVISYDEWVGGRPCLSESFAFRVTPNQRSNEFIHDRSPSLTLRV